MSETVTGAELARLILRRGTTAAEIAAMDVEDVAKMVAYRRRKKARGPVDPAMTDEQIARAILEHAQSDPSDWPVAPRATTSKRACGAGLLGALGGGVGAVVFVVVGATWYFNGLTLDDVSSQVIFVGAILGTPLAAILGAALALVIARVKTGTGLLKRAILPLATGLAVGFIIAACYWLFLIASKEGVFEQLAHRSADSLIKRYQAGKRKFNGWNLSEEDLSGAMLSGAGLSGADLSGANLSGADLRGADLRGANLRMANLTGANLSDADLSGAALQNTDLTGADLSGTDLDGAYLLGVDLSGVDLSGFDLSEFFLTGADLSGADLRGFDLSGAYLQGADLSGADLSGADLSDANLREVDLSGADLSEANLDRAELWDADLSGAALGGADLSGAGVTDEQLAQARSLVGATMPDGTVHE